MTKNEILVRVSRATEHAWLELARDLDIRCPRESVARMFEWEQTDEHRRALLYAWAALKDLQDEVGTVDDDVSEDMADRATTLNSKVYRECRAAEEAKQ